MASASLSIGRATTLAKRHGMAVGRLGLEAVTWDGTTANLDALGRANQWRACWPRGLRPTSVVAGNLVHEVAHFLVAAPRRRGLPNFGLGADGLSPARPESSVQRKTAEVEETLATLLGRALKHELAHELFRGVSEHPPAVQGEALRELVRRALLTPEGVPTPRAMGRAS